MRPMLALVVLVLVTGITLPWWGNSPGVAATTPRLAVGGFVTLDPVQASSLEEFRLLDALCEPLVRINPQTLQPEPALAERWSSDATSKEWTFTLRAARWSDGSPVTAAQMAAGLQRHRDGSASGSALDAIAAVTALDDHTLLITCHRSQATLAQILATPVFIPLHPAMAAPTAWTDPRQIIGNGPMICSHIAPRHHLDLAPSPTYRGPASAKGAVRLLIVDDAGASVRLYLDRRVDAVLRLNSDTIGDLRRVHSPDLQSTGSWGTELYRLRIDAHDDRPLIPLAVRRALAHSIDRAALVHELLNDNGVPATTLVPRTSEPLGYQPPYTVLAYDLESARRELAEFRSETNQAIPPIELLVPSNQPERLRIAEWLCDRWQRDLGMSVHVAGVPANLAQSRVKAHDYDLARGSLIGDYLDPAYFLHCFQTTAGMNRTGFSDPDFDALLLKAEEDPAQRLAVLSQAEKRLLESAAIIPLFHYACSFLVTPSLQGIHANTLEQVRYFAVGF